MVVDDEVSLEESAVRFELVEEWWPTVRLRKVRRVAIQQFNWLNTSERVGDTHQRYLPSHERHCCASITSFLRFNKNRSRAPRASSWREWRCLRNDAAGSSVETSHVIYLFPFPIDQVDVLFVLDRLVDKSDFISKIISSTFPEEILGFYSKSIREKLAQMPQIEL